MHVHVIIIEKDLKEKEGKGLITPVKNNLILIDSK